MTKCQAENQETIRTSADQFIADVRKRLPQYEASEVINTDQSGIQLELHSTRTLSHKGEKVTIGSVRSIKRYYPQLYSAANNRTRWSSPLAALPLLEGAQRTHEQEYSLASF